HGPGPGKGKALRRLPLHSGLARQWQSLRRGPRRDRDLVRRLPRLRGRDDSRENRPHGPDGDKRATRRRKRAAPCPRRKRLPKKPPAGAGGRQGARGLPKGVRSLRERKPLARPTTLPKISSRG